MAKRDNQKTLITLANLSNFKNKIEKKINIPTFTPTSVDINLDLINFTFNCELDSSDVADILENKYERFNIDVTSVESNIVFDKNIIINDNGDFLYQYIGYVDNENAVYRLLLNFVDDESTNKSSIIKITETKLYRHSISSEQANAIIISTSSTPYTYTSLQQFLLNDSSIIKAYTEYSSGPSTIVSIIESNYKTLNIQCFDFQLGTTSNVIMPFGDDALVEFHDIVTTL